MLLTYSISQVMCILGLVLFGISMQKSSRKDIVKWQIFSFLLYATQYFLLGAYLGMLTYLINMIRSIVFFIFEKNIKY